MTFQEIKAFLARVSYKPGVQFDVRWAPSMDAIHLRIVVVANNADYTKERPTRIVVSGGTVLSLDYYKTMNETGLLDSVKKLIKIFENHEQDEWLRVDGMVVTEPHPEIHGEKRVWIPKEKK